MDHATLSRERLTSTKLVPYDMITVVTQRAINKQLKAMYDKNESLRKIDLKNLKGKDTYSGLEAELYPPTVQLQIDTQNRIVLYFLNIKSATIRYLEPDIANMKFNKETCKIEDARIAVSVDLTFETKAFTDLPPDLRQILARLGDYSINRLLIDFTSASLARLDKLHSNYQAKLAHLDPTASGQFDVFINAYFNELGKEENRDASVLHYVPLANADTDRNKYPMPSVPPTALTFQNIPFLQSEQDKGSPNDDNMLVYLQVTNKKCELPHELLVNSANWVVPPPPDKETERYDGTVALSRRIFLDEWLLPKLAEFNRDSTWIAEEAWFETVDVIKAIRHMRGSMGWVHATPDDIKWQATGWDNVEQWAKDKIKTTTALGGDWYKYKKSGEKDNGGFIQRVWQKTSTLNYCFIPAGYNTEGKCEIVVAGRTEVEFYDRSDLLPTTINIIGTWSTKLVLSGVEDGELVITADKIDPQIEKKIDYAPLHKGDLDYLITSTENGFKRLNMTSLLDKFTKVFRNGWDFILPGAADFYINRAVFNSRKDLLCELKYRDIK